jgi:cation diffusion facilitator family transporter
VHPHALSQGGLAVAVMAISTVLTALLLAAQSRVLRRTSSVAVSSDRTHYAMDLASNIAALAGIAAATWLGMGGLDAYAALLIAGLLLWGAVSVFREASGQLMDHELPAADRARIVRLMTADSRLTDVHQLRTRASGPFVHMQMHVDLDPQLTLEVAHEVIVAAEQRVLEAFPSADIIIHADPRGLAEPHGGAFAETHTHENPSGPETPAAAGT